MKSTFSILGLSTLAILIGSIAGTYIARAQTALRNPHVVALVAHQQTKMLDADGAIKKTQDTTIAVRADGSQVEIHHAVAPDGKPITYTKLWDVSGARRVVANGLVKAITSYPLGQTQVKTKLAQTSDPACGLGTDVDHKSLLGYEAIHAIQEREKTVTVERWRVPSLGCFELKSVARMRGADGKELVTNVEVLSLEQRTPPSELFVIPDWPEMSQAVAVEESIRKSAAAQPNK